MTKIFVKKVYDFFDLLVDYPEIGSIENPIKGIRGFTIVKQVTDILLPLKIRVTHDPTFYDFFVY